jgi:hypothetical protein
MVALEGDCKTPLGAYGERWYPSASTPGGEPRSGELSLRAFISAPDGTNLRRAETRVAWPVSDADARAVGEALGARLRPM